MEGIAWANYLREHKWLLDGISGAETEVSSEEFGVEMQMDWAVYVILAKLERVLGQS